MSKAKGVWLRVPVVKNLKEARRLPVRVEEQQPQQLGVNPPRSAGDGRQEIQLTAMVPIELPVVPCLRAIPFCLLPCCDLAEGVTVSL